MNYRQKVFYTALVCIFVLFTSIGADTNPGVSHSIKLPIFSADSVWNIQIGENPRIDPNSEVMINRIIHDIKRGKVAELSVHEWSSTLFFADKNTPRIDVTLKNVTWHRFSKIKNVPIPAGAVPDPEGDGHMCIIDLSERFVYEFWQAKKQSNRSWSASWVNRISLDSNGIYKQGMSSRGSGFSVIAGMIWPEELKGGKINHALVMSLPTVKAGGPVPPATETDGRKKVKGAIPEGARLQLDPAVNLDDYNLTEYERTIAECLQTYGAFVGDVSGNVELEALNPLSYSSDPYGGIFDEQWIFLPNIPWDKLRVLELAPQIEDPVVKVMDESIYE